MTKAEFCAKHGVNVRPVTRDDIAQASTDYQRLSNYIIEYKGVEWYSKHATLKDIKRIMTY